MQEVKSAKPPPVRLLDVQRSYAHFKRRRMFSGLSAGSSKNSEEDDPVGAAEGLLDAWVRKLRLQKENAELITSDNPYLKLTA